MTSYMEFYNSLYNIDDHAGTIPVLVPGLGNHTSDNIVASVSEFKEFGFLAAYGVTYTYDPSIGNGSGVLSSESEALFPLIGDDRPYIIKVKITDVTNGRFQLGLFAESTIPDGTFYIASDTYNGDTNIVDLAGNSVVNTTFHSTNVSRVGSSSIYCNVANNYVKVTADGDDKDSYNIDPNDAFTYCFWIYNTGSNFWPTTHYISNDYEYKTFTLYTRASGYAGYWNLEFSGLGINQQFVIGWIQRNVWYHFAITKEANSSSAKIFIDGVHKSTLSTNSTTAYVHNWSSLEAVGYVDDILFCKECLWTDDFTPPTTPVIDLLL